LQCDFFKTFATVYATVSTTVAVFCSNMNFLRHLQRLIRRFYNRGNVFVAMTGKTKILAPCTVDEILLFFANKKQIIN
jgi:hypothetical protein